MPRVHKLTAAKDYPDKGIKKGDTYYKWTTRPGGRGKGIVHRQATYPKRQQLTSSDFLIQVYDIEDRIADLVADDALEGERDSIVDDIRALAEEQSEKLSNMPEGLQQSPTGEILQERADACEAWASEIEAVTIPDEGDEGDNYEDALQQAVEEIQGCEISV